MEGTFLQAAPPSGAIESIVAAGLLQKLVYVRRQVYQNDASVFLEFAREDLLESTTRGLANALTNAKRAIANRVDTLLYTEGMRGFARRGNWGFPAKIAKLSEVGISTPQVLNNLVNRKRNVLEHEYRIPSSNEEVQNIIDIADLYLDNTQKYLEPGVIQAIFGSDSASVDAGESLAAISSPSFGIVFDFDQDQLQLFGVLGSANQTQFSAIGERPATRIFQAILLAFLGRQVPIASCETEESFWDRFM